MLSEFLLRRKMSRIITRLMQRLDITPERAIDVFYQSDIGAMMHEEQYGLQCMPDAYIVEEIILELQRKQG
ncbi:DUF3791 domain-containing protein [Bacteroides sp. GD17]|jgi:hypothetical protein|uniref:DUF3791 domain-containing protein n=1 Tax=Bacteroides sp. GD17 TaxID=3139826 RepID=UPI0025E65F62|nr:DUF3791 domain-containing protein [uncultured Bacteroides sp.]